MNKHKRNKQIEDLGEVDTDDLAPGAIADMMVAKGTFPTTEATEASGPVTNLGVVGKTTREAAAAAAAGGDSGAAGGASDEKKPEDDKKKKKEQEEEEEGAKEPPAKRAKTSS